MQKDYGYFGSGTEGYIQYKQAFDRIQSENENSDEDDRRLGDEAEDNEE